MPSAIRCATDLHLDDVAGRAAPRPARRPPARPPRPGRNASDGTRSLGLGHALQRERQPLVPGRARTRADARLPASATRIMSDARRARNLWHCRRTMRSRSTRPTRWRTRGDAIVDVAREPGAAGRRRRARCRSSASIIGAARRSSLVDDLATRGIFRKYEHVLDLGGGLGGTTRYLDVAARLHGDRDSRVRRGGRRRAACSPRAPRSTSRSSTSRPTRPAYRSPRPRSPTCGSSTCCRRSAPSVAVPRGGVPRAPAGRASGRCRTSSPATTTNAAARGFVEERVRAVGARAREVRRDLPPARGRPVRAGADRMGATSPRRSARTDALVSRPGERSRRASRVARSRWFSSRRDGRSQREQRPTTLRPTALRPTTLRPTTLRPATLPTRHRSGRARCRRHHPPPPPGMVTATAAATMAHARTRACARSRTRGSAPAATTAVLHRRSGRAAATYPAARIALDDHRAAAGCTTGGPRHCRRRDTSRRATASGPPAARGSSGCGCGRLHAPCVGHAGRAALRPSSRPAAAA